MRRMRASRSSGYICVWGTSPKEKVVDAEGVEVECPSCHRTARMIGKSVVPYCTIFYIPLFPEGSGKEFMECSACGAQFQGTVGAIRQRMDDARSKLAGQIEERERALRQDPNDVDNACELVDLYMAADREGDALRLVGTLCRSFPDDPQVCFLQGRIHLSAGRYPNALEAFERAIGLNPQHGGAHFLKAVTLLQMQPPRLETALEEARLAHEYGHPEARDLMRTIEQAQREGRT